MRSSATRSPEMVGYWAEGCQNLLLLEGLVWPPNCLILSLQALLIPTDNPSSWYPKWGGLGNVKGGAPGLSRLPSTPHPMTLPAPKPPPPLGLGCPSPSFPAAPQPRPWGCFGTRSTECGSLRLDPSQPPGHICA